jgi:hypothetical protein
VALAPLLDDRYSHCSIAVLVAHSFQFPITASSAFTDLRALAGQPLSPVHRLFKARPERQLDLLNPFVKCNKNARLSCVAFPAPERLVAIRCLELCNARALLRE